MVKRSNIILKRAGTEREIKISRKEEIPENPAAQFKFRKTWGKICNYEKLSGVKSYLTFQASGFEGDAEVENSDMDEGEQLCEAAKNGDSDKVRALIESGADVSHFDADGLSPLMHAAKLGYAEVLKTLLSAGAPWNALSPSNLSAGDFAMEAGRQEAFEVLLNAGTCLFCLVSLCLCLLDLLLYFPAKTRISQSPTTIYLSKLKVQRRNLIELHH